MTVFIMIRIFFQALMNAYAEGRYKDQENSIESEIEKQKI